jgi:hypothetical protein
MLTVIDEYSRKCLSQRTAYVVVTRDREQAQIFTADRIAMLKAGSRPDDPLSTTKLSQAPAQKPTLWRRVTCRPQGMAQQESPGVRDLVCE